MKLKTNKCKTCNKEIINSTSMYCSQECRKNQKTIKTLTNLKKKYVMSKEEEEWINNQITMLQNETK